MSDRRRRRFTPSKIRRHKWWMREVGSNQGSCNPWTVFVRITRGLPVLLLVALSLVVVPASTASSQWAVAAGGQHSCALSSAGTVHCWGDNTSGQATDQTATTYTAIAAGARHSCAITTAGAVHCWGDN